MQDREQRTGSAVFSLWSLFHASLGSLPTACLSRPAQRWASNCPRAKSPTNVLVSAAMSHAGWKDLPCHLHLSMRQPHYWLQSCCRRWKSQDETGKWGQKEKECGTDRAGLDASFIMGDPRISLCVAARQMSCDVGAAERVGRGGSAHIYFQAMNWKVEHKELEDQEGALSESWLLQLH